MSPMTVFDGRNILPGFPEKLVKVIDFLNEKASTGEFVFCDDFDYWEDKENLIDSLGLGHEANGLYFAVSLAYFANRFEGHIVFPEKVNVWRWAWSLQILANVAEWSPSFMANVMESFDGHKEGIDGLMNRSAQQYSKTNYENALALLQSRQQNRIHIHAGLMENDFNRYCNQFPPIKDTEEFATAFVQTYELSMEDLEKAFAIALKFPDFNTTAAMAFYLTLLERFEGDKKECCERKVAELLKGDTARFVAPLCNWLFTKQDITPFVEDCILSIIMGLDPENKGFALKSIDDAVHFHLKDPDFITKLFICISENLHPTDILEMDGCLHSLYEHKDYFQNFIITLIIHPKGMYRLVGRRLWDDYHWESSDFNPQEVLLEKLQCLFVISMLQDYGNPETRLPKLLPLLDSKSEQVRNILMGQLGPYLDDYMGHVVTALDNLKLESKYVDVIKQYYERRADALEKRRNMKELSPRYSHMFEFQETMRLQKVHLQEQMREAEKKHKSILKEIAKNVVLARGGGWRDENGKVHHLAHVKYSMPSRQLVQSMSPMEQEEWLNELLRDWDVTSRSN